MTIEVADETLHGLKLTKPQVLLDFAVGLFTNQRVTLGRAAKISGLTQLEFQKEIARRGISLHYDVQDLNDDLQTLESLREK